MDQLIKDVRHSLRALARQPGFTLVAILTLGLGLGATTAIFSVVRASLLAPLPWSEPDRRVMIWSRWRGWDKTWVSSAEVRDYRAARSLRGVAAWGSGQVNLTGTGEPERVGAGQATANVFDVLGARPLIGRGFQHGEDASGTGARRRRPLLQPLATPLRRRPVGRRPDHPDRRRRLRGHRRHAEGLPAADRLQRGLRGADRALDAARARPDPNDRGNHGFYAAAVLAPGFTAAQASAEVTGMGRAQTAQGLYPRPHAVRAVRGVAGGRSARARASRAWRCSLPPPRRCCSSSPARTSRTFSSRDWRAGGANWPCARRSAPARWHLVRQMLTETLLLGLGGGLLGAALALGRRGRRGRIRHRGDPARG